MSEPKYGQVRRASGGKSGHSTIMLIAPLGRQNSQGSPFWNAMVLTAGLLGGYRCHTVIEVTIPNDTRGWTAIE